MGWSSGRRPAWNRTIKEWTRAGAEVTESGGTDCQVLQELEALDPFSKVSVDHDLQCKPVCVYVCVCVFFCLSSSASLLACGIRQASSQIYIAPDSLIGVERYSSSLAIENAPEDVQEYSWHRGANDTEKNLIISYNATSHSRRDGPMYSGRESVSIRGTLRIWRSQLNDTGNYTVRVDTINDTQRATGWLKILGELAAAPPPNCS